MHPGPTSTGGTRSTDSIVILSDRLAAMVSSTSRRSSQYSEHSIEQCVAEALRQGVLKRRDHLKLSATLLTDAQLSPQTRQQINEVFDLVRAGRIRLAD